MSYPPEGLCRLIAHRWLHEIRNGKASNREIHARLADLDPQIRPVVQAWLRHWRAHDAKPPKIDR